jgi:hypothetical protein
MSNNMPYGLAVLKQTWCQVSPLEPNGPYLFATLDLLPSVEVFEALWYNEL